MMFNKHPSLIQELIGHRSAVKQLANFYNKGWKNFIIRGPNGVGKASMVYSFIKSIINPVLVEKGTHPELFVLEDNVGVKEIRDARHFLSFANDNPKILLIDAPLNNQSANCLLKVSEDNHNDLIFIIEHSFIPKTLLSRFWEIRLGLLSPDDLAKLQLSADELAIAQGCLGQLGWFLDIKRELIEGWLKLLSDLKQNQALDNWFLDLDQKSLQQVILLIRFVCSKLASKGSSELLDAAKTLALSNEYYDKRQLILWASAQIALVFNYTKPSF